MSRFSPVDLSAYPVSDVIETLAFESYLARDREDFSARWAVRRSANPALPEFDALLLESDPSSVALEVGAYRELLLRGYVNDKVRALTLAGATGRALDHLGVTYYRTPRRILAEPTESSPAMMEDDETYRQRLALAPESWSTAGPVGAYLFWGLSASGDVRDIAAYSEDEGVCLAPRIRIPVLSQTGVAGADLLRTVRDRLSRDDIRPLGDLVTTESAVPIDFNVEVTLRLRAGASAEVVKAAALTRIQHYCNGRLRWIGEAETGPVWLIGRRMRIGTIAAAALGTDANAVEVEVISPASDVNAPDAGYTEAALSGVGAPDFAPLDAALTAHLFKAPRVGAITVNHEIVSGSWI